MNLLLDTHTAIWFVTDSNQLPKSAKQLIENPDINLIWDKRK